MIKGILLILATLFAVFIVSGIIYTKIFGPINGKTADVTSPSAPSVTTSVNQK
jgi:hypothetical protein